MNPLDDPRLTAMGLLAEVHAGISMHCSPAYTQAGLSEVDFETLVRLARSPHRSLRMSDLAGQTSMSTSGITRVVDRLEREGLVERKSCVHDRRASYAVLTEAGSKRLDSVLPQHIDDIEKWFTGLLPPQQLDEFLVALRTIRDVVRPCATAGVDRPFPG
jgi:MarR family 2-MHQ and catechol resistance regulon transcriptional repressor